MINLDYKMKNRLRIFEEILVNYENHERTLSSKLFSLLKTKKQV
jgi:hypothetical protein